ncbi:MAG: hypothetical protein M3Y74_11110, partial [Chloroflexota bacterium]|nr:hypothetical protein [Chloroflexota bacterium]
MVCRDAVEVKGDRARLERVLQNLVDTALTYSVPGQGVHVVVTQGERGQTDEPGTRRATFTVSDRGAMIPGGPAAYLH